MATRWPPRWPKIGPRWPKLAQDEPKRPQDKKMLLRSGADIANFPFFAHLPRKITTFGGPGGHRRDASQPKRGPRRPLTRLNINLSEHGNGKRVNIFVCRHMSPMCQRITTIKRMSGVRELFRLNGRLRARGWVRKKLLTRV